VREQLLLTRIESAKQDISAAEEELEQAIRDLRVVPRAEKTTVSKVLEDAVAKVRAARTKLSELESLVASEK
jgi:hypothetical protein